MLLHEAVPRHRGEGVQHPDVGDAACRELVAHHGIAPFLRPGHGARSTGSRPGGGVAECAHARRRGARRSRPLRPDGRRDGPHRPVRGRPGPDRAGGAVGLRRLVGAGRRGPPGGERGVQPRLPRRRRCRRCSSGSAPPASPTWTRSTPTACGSGPAGRSTTCSTSGAGPAPAPARELRHRDGKELPTSVGPVPGAVAGVPPRVGAGHPRRRHRRPAAPPVADEWRARFAVFAVSETKPEVTVELQPGTARVTVDGRRGDPHDRRPGGRHQRPAAGRPPARPGAAGRPQRGRQLSRWPT